VGHINGVQGGYRYNTPTKFSCIRAYCRPEEVAVHPVLGEWQGGTRAGGGRKRGGGTTAIGAVGRLHKPTALASHEPPPNAKTGATGWSGQRQHRQLLVLLHYPHESFLAGYFDSVLS